MAGEDHHTPVCWREYEYKCEDLGARGTQDALKINTLAHRSRRVILIPIMPMKDVYQSQENPFWSWISTRDTFRIEIAATPECQEAYGRPESFCFGRFGQPRLEHPWRKSVDADRLNSDHSLGENSVIDQLEPLLGPTFDTSRVDPRDLAADHPMVMWLRFDPDDMSKIILTTVPYEKDVFDYDARPESPRVWCGLCLRSIPEELFSTPCAFHPGLFCACILYKQPSN